ncbi:ABC-1 domain protein [gamma proteobacterium HTCC5015]|nr:ABC-1 domain protein [gamma proteobacterium HTCC5015]
MYYIRKRAKSFDPHQIPLSPLPRFVAQKQKIRRYTLGLIPTIGVYTLIPMRKTMDAVLNQIDYGIKGAFRLGQTASVLSGTGVRWALGDRPPLPKLLRQTFERLGSTYIKLGQFVASSPSLFPEEYVREFEGCLDKTAKLPFRYIQDMIETELGQPMGEVYSWVDPTPLASASIAQVHAARLKSGEDVVIKVQKPGVKNILLTDFNFLLFGARILERLVPQMKRASLGDIVADIQTTMMEECDFLNEAENLKTFARFLADTGNNEVVCPKVYDQATSLRVLTMERFFGVPLTDLDSIKQHSQDPKNTLLVAMNTWFQSLMMCEFFHADVHAGNLMVLEDGRIGFIDFGIVGRIRPETWGAVTQFIQATSSRNFDVMASSMLTIGMTDEKVDVNRLASDIRAVFGQVEQISDSSVLLSGDEDQDVNKLLMDIVAIGRDHGIRFPREFALLIKQFLYFDRYVHILAPEMDMFMDDGLMMMPEFDSLTQH